MSRGGVEAHVWLCYLVMKNKNTGTGTQNKHWTIKCEREWHDVKSCVVLCNIGDLGWRQQQPPLGTSQDQGPLQ